MLSSTGVRRSLVHAAAMQGILKRDGQAGELSADVVDRALGRLAGASLLTFSLDGSRVSVHRLVMRIIREQLVAGNSLSGVWRGGCATARRARRATHWDVVSGPSRCPGSDRPVHGPIGVVR